MKLQPSTVVRWLAALFGTVTFSVAGGCQKPESFHLVGTAPNAPATVGPCPNIVAYVGANLAAGIPP